MPNVHCWWQPAENPYHCRPNDLFFSANFPKEGDAPFALSARPGATQPVQFLLHADRDMEVIALSLDTPWLVRVPALYGIDRLGKPFESSVTVKAGRPWPIWVLLMVPMEIRGEFAFTCDVSFADGSAVSIPLEVTVSGDVVHHGGEDEPSTLARLAWLNSDLGCEDTLVAPFTPVQASGRQISILGRDLVIGETGLPAQMITHFMGINDALTPDGIDILAAPIALTAIQSGKPLSLTPSPLRIEITDTNAVWLSDKHCEKLSCQIDASLSFDGWMRFRVTWSAHADIALDDIRLTVCLQQAFARWFTGVGTMAKENLTHHRWQWDSDKHQDGFFCGGMNGGIVCRPVDEHYVRPYCNIYYKKGPRNQPKAWVNGGAGFFELVAKDGFTQLEYHTGVLRLAAGETLHTDFDIGFTPFKPVSQAKHYATRYYHAPGETTPDEWIEAARRVGATHINVHHAKEIYPFINYPMYDGPAMHDFIRRAHQQGFEVKPYYTVRELTSKLPEFFPLRSLGGEILAQPNYHFDGVPGQGDKDDWLSQECGNAVLPAWKAVFTKGKYAGQCDPSVIVNPASRIINFYVEGLRWMCDSWHIDGIYVDDTGLDRHDFQRMRRVLNGRRPGAKIDLHSWNHFHDEWGESWGHNAVMYAELFPYIDSLWFGEGFDFNELSPVEMLVECSGLPFGLMGEMLEGGGNPWRGLLFGQTARAGWRPNGPEGIWAMREKYGFASAKMNGWWEDAQPIQANDDRVLITLYDLPEGTMLCAASFADDTVTVRFTIDTERLGFTPIAAHLPEIQHVQPFAEVELDASYTIEPKQGVVIFFKKENKLDER